MTRHTPRLPRIIALIAFVGALVGLVMNGYAFRPPPAPMAGSQDGPSTLTDALGRFRFDGLNNSSHVLRVDAGTLPPGVQAASGPAALTLSPGVTQALAVAPDVTLLATYQDDGATIGGTLFRDQDGDRRQGPGEPGLPGVRVIDPDVYQYFVPFNDDNLYRSFSDVIDSSCLATPTASRTIDSTISMTASSPNTSIYYDHWEDGYDADPLNPAPGSTTVVTQGVRAGAVQTWPDLIPLPRDRNALRYDGRDRITVFGQPASAIRAAWIDQNPDTLLAGAWEMARVSDWGRRYILPIGEDLGRLQDPTAPFLDFDYVSLEIMAAYNGTIVQVDADADGAFELTQTINAGETTFVRGSASQQGVVIRGGAAINATLPVQVQVRAGNCRALYSGRSYTLVPVERWSNDYWSPVSTFFDGRNNCDVRYGSTQPNPSADVDIYIFNPNNTPLTVNFEDASTAGGPPGTLTAPIPPRSTGSFLSLHPGFVRSNTRGVHLTANLPFWAVTAVDSTSLGNDGADFDWSYALIPAGSLSARAVVSWAPGSDPTAPPPNPPVNGSTVYVQAVVDGTILQVDLNGDGTPDQVDTDGNVAVNTPSNYGYDEVNSAAGIPLNRGQMVRISDPNDRDMTGAIISSQGNNFPLAAVFGEDACVATRASPFLDLGYTILPLPVPEFSKNATLLIDADRSNDESPGDTLNYTVTAYNNGNIAIENPVIIDTLPYTYTDLVVGTIQSTHPASLQLVSTTFDDGSNTFTAPESPQIYAFRIQYNGSFQPNTSITVTFQARLDAQIPPEIRSVTNYARLTSDNTPDKFADVTTPINQVDLLIHKTDGLDLVEAGQQITYTITYTNAGPGIAYNVAMTDTLPPTALNVSSPTVPGVITPTIEPGRIIFQIGKLNAGQVGTTTVSLTLGPGTPPNGQVVNVVSITTTSHEPNTGNNTSTDIDRTPSLAVVLSELRAERRPDGVLVRWTTLAELDSYGFRVYRSPTPGRAGAVLVTPNVIPGQGRGRSGGASYSFFDAGAPDGPLYYWLEEIDLSGLSTFHGPATPTLQAIRFTWFLPVVSVSR